METPHDSGPVSLQRGKDVAPNANSRISDVGVRGVLERFYAKPGQVVANLVPPHRKERSHEHAASGRHAAQARQTAATQKMKDDPFHHIVGGVRNRNDVSVRLYAGALEKLIAKRASARLNGAPRERPVPATDQHTDTQPATQRANMFGCAS